jgi:hypothetical protein
MPREAPAIERTWYAIAPTGEGMRVSLSVGVPMQEPGGEWSALVSLGVLERGSKIFGEDGWQAMALGMRFIAARVADFSERGWRFFWREGGESVGVEDLHVG